MNRIRRAIVRAAPTCTLWERDEDLDVYFLVGSHWFLNTRVAYLLPRRWWAAISNATMIQRREIDEASR